MEEKITGKEKNEDTQQEAVKEKAESAKRWSGKRWAAVIAGLLVLFVAIPVVNELIPQKVNVKYIGLDGEKTEVYWTRSHRVSDFIDENKSGIEDDDVVLDLFEKDAMDISPDEVGESLKMCYLGITGKMEEGESYLPFDKGFELLAADMDHGKSEDLFIENGMTIRVKKAEPSTAKIGGEKQDINIYPGSVAETLGYNDIKFDEDDVVKPALDDEVEAGDKIKLTRVKIVDKDKTLEIQPEEKGAVFDRSLASGTIMRTEGKPGKAVYTYTYKYVNGKKIKTTKKFKKWVKKPVDIRLTFGTSETGETGDVDYSETFIGNCTAYYAGNNAHGATGQRCYYGTCAVDPKVIPYGTKLYVEGYGTAIANDCGGAVKGHIIDLYMKSTKACFQWGRRNKKVYILR